MLRQVGKSDIDRVPGNTEELLLTSGWDTELRFCGMDSSQGAEQLDSFQTLKQKKRLGDRHSRAKVKGKGTEV